jgi:hypothetical protein
MLKIGVYRRRRLPMTPEQEHEIIAERARLSSGLSREEWDAFEDGTYDHSDVDPIPDDERPFGPWTKVLRVPGELSDERLAELVQLEESGQPLPANTVAKLAIEIRFLRLGPVGRIRTIESRP